MAALRLERLGPAAHADLEPVRTVPCLGAPLLLLRQALVGEGQAHVVGDLARARDA